MDQIIKAFVEFVNSLNLVGILPLSTGLSAVALLTAALLILVALIKRKTSTAGALLVIFFCVTAVAFVYIHTLRPDPQPATLRLMSARLPAGEPFPIHVRIGNGDEADIITTARIEEKLTGNDISIIVNAAEVAAILANKKVLVSEMSKQIERLSGNGTSSHASLGQ